MEAVPVNGFWFLEADADKTTVSWRSLTARGSWGRVAHDYLASPRCLT